MMSDPGMLSEMLTKNLTMIVPQIATGAWVNFFFSGFVVAKVPFPLTQKFKLMLQRGVELNSLDVSYVSSLSWCESTRKIYSDIYARLLSLCLSLSVSCKLLNVPKILTSCSFFVSLFYRLSQSVWNGGLAELNFGRENL